ncbi:hypothetical protein EJ03DRAFT_331074 [Teratosphaeria nubilosa]|uniref:Uncharacterized protein n=1 Tax=Teratosphaeria nubilosa TaxID=161662 RepID=A0A6G1KXF1_9PEZI|nr:hypothetical protein EJ03DRAFT_331074 [Teratosphaeria nubilosa]
MASPLSSVPRASFVHHSYQLQALRRHASTSPLQSGLFKAPATVIAPWKCVASAQEWQTSAYHYNKQTLKTLPTAHATTNKLLQDYSTMSQGNLGNNPESTARRAAVTAKRRAADRVYISGANVKDFGDRVVVDAFVYDAVEGAKEERQRRRESKRARQGGDNAGPARRGPALRSAGAGSGAGANRGPPAGARRMAPGGTRGPVNSGVRR